MSTLWSQDWSKYCLLIKMPYCPFVGVICFYLCTLSHPLLPSCVIYTTVCTRPLWCVHSGFLSASFFWAGQKAVFSSVLVLCFCGSAFYKRQVSLFCLFVSQLKHWTCEYSCHVPVSPFVFVFWYGEVSPVVIWHYPSTVSFCIWRHRKILHSYAPMNDRFCIHHCI